MISEHVQVARAADPGDHDILSPEAIAFVVALQREFGTRREALLEERRQRQLALDAGEMPDFLSETRRIREGDWHVAPAPAEIADRRCEITGPTERKMIINALNSGARAFMADFEDATSPTWSNLLEGQANLIDAVERTISVVTSDKVYSLSDNVAVLFVRPRGWHLVEKHLIVDGAPMSASLFDFGLYVFHCAERLRLRGSAPYFYLPKLEGHREARLWNDVFSFVEAALNLPTGTIRATVLIENILAAFEMDEILYELRDHSAGLNAGRWDYIFSVIRKFRNRPDFVLPDRIEVGMTAPFMRAYTELLVQTCHRRGAHAIGGMAAFIPSRKDPAVNATALAKVREDKSREAGDGFDGTWVAHPDLVEVATAEFDSVLAGRPNQIDRKRDDIRVTAADLLGIADTPGQVTEAGIRVNISVGIEYLASWLRGAGAVGIRNLMEDAATAEISRSQIWQWVHHGTRLADGRRVDAALVATLADDEMNSLRKAYAEAAYGEGGFDKARQLFEEVALGDDYVEFLTEPAYQQLDPGGI